MQCMDVALGIEHDKGNAFSMAEAKLSQVYSDEVDTEGRFTLHFWQKRYTCGVVVTGVFQEVQLVSRSVQIS